MRWCPQPDRGVPKRYDDMGKRTLTGRRELLRALGASGLAAMVTSALPLDGPATAGADGRPSKTLRVWVFSDAHVSRDKQQGKGLESLARGVASVGIRLRI